MSNMKMFGEEITRSPLRKRFAWYPVKLDSGHWCFFKPMYYRFCEWDPFGSSSNAEWFEHYSEEEATALLLSEKDAVVEKSILPFEHFMLTATSTKMVVFVTALLIVLSLV